MPIKLIVHPRQTISLRAEAYRTVYSGGEPYTGEYLVTPKTNAITVLQTANKIMTTDLQVSAVPQYEVSNQSGGQTLIIGKEYFSDGN